MKAIIRKVISENRHGIINSFIKGEDYTEQLEKSLYDQLKWLKFWQNVREITHVILNIFFILCCFAMILIVLWLAMQFNIFNNIK